MSHYLRCRNLLFHSTLVEHCIPYCRCKFNSFRVIKSLLINFLLHYFCKILFLLMKSHTGSVISESTLTKIISGLNETTGVILEYLQDAKVKEKWLKCVKILVIKYFLIYDHDFAGTWTEKGRWSSCFSSFGRKVLFISCNIFQNPLQL